MVTSRLKSCLKHPSWTSQGVRDPGSILEASDKELDLDGSTSSAIIALKRGEAYDTSRRARGYRLHCQRIQEGPQETWQTTIQAQKERVLPLPQEGPYQGRVPEDDNGEDVDEKKKASAIALMAGNFKGTIIMRTSTREPRTRDQQSTSLLTRASSFSSEAWTRKST